MGGREWTWERKSKRGHGQERERKWTRRERDREDMGERLNVEEKKKKKTCKGECGSGRENERIWEREGERGREDVIGKEIESGCGRVRKNKGELMRSKQTRANLLLCARTKQDQLDGRLVPDLIPSSWTYLTGSPHLDDYNY